MARSRSRSRGTRAGLRTGRSRVARPGHGGPTLSRSTGGVGQFSSGSGRRGGGRGSASFGVKSKAQWRWMYATKKKFAKRWSHERKYKSLPARKGKPTARSAR